jgi:hypothetical protein
MNGALADDDAVVDEIVRDSAVLGTIPENTTLGSQRGGRSVVLSVLATRPH